MVVTRLAAAVGTALRRAGAAVAAVAGAMLTSVPVAGAVTVTVRGRLAPVARLATTGQVTTPLETVPPLLAETKVTADGKKSRTTVLAAVEGPLLVTTMV